MPWLRLTLSTTAPWFEELSDLLLAAGAPAVTALDAGDQPILEPDPGAMPLWQHVQVQALWPPEAPLAPLREQLAAWSAARQQPMPALDTTFVPDQDWSRTWRDGLEPRRYGDRLWVLPGDWPDAQDFAGVHLYLDPGLAFGSGTHPTTSLCLHQLAALPLAGCRLIDYGCGSGILAIAGLLLGADQALAVDHDPQALTATRDNAIRNGVAAARLQCCAPGDSKLADWHGQADILLANILAGPLTALAPTLTGLLRPGATLVLSGILASQWPGVAAAYPDVQFATPLIQDDWVCAVGVVARPGSEGAPVDG